MRVNPVSAAGRSIVRRNRPSPGEANTERRAEFTAELPVPLEPVLERTQEAFSAHYRPNSVFLAHLIAARDIDLETRPRLKTLSEIGADAYRTTAALPRQRSVGHVLKTER